MAELPAQHGAVGGELPRVELHIRAALRRVGRLRARATPSAPGDGGRAGLHPFDSEWVELLWSLGEAAMLLDEREAARAVHDALEPYADRWAVDGYGGACFGQVADLLARLADYLGRPTAAPPGRAGVRPDGHGVAAGVPRPGRDRASTPRACAISPCCWPGPGGRSMCSTWWRPPADRPGPQAGSDTGPVIDAAARAAYQRRLVDLEDEIETAAREQRLGPAGDARSRAGVPRCRAGRCPRSGRSDRLTGDRAERARKAVAMRIGTALKAIEAVHPELARHLRNSVSTGRFCRYLPDQEHHLAADGAIVTMPCRMWRLPGERDGPARRR